MISKQKRHSSMLNRNRNYLNNKQHFKLTEPVVFHWPVFSNHPIIKLTALVTLLINSNKSNNNLVLKLQQYNFKCSFDKDLQCILIHCKYSNNFILNNFTFILILLNVLIVITCQLKLKRIS